MIGDTQAQKQIILNNALLLIPTLGWNENMLEQASINAGYDKNYGKLILIDGINELIDIYFKYIDCQMLEALSKINTKDLGITAKIKLALKIRIKILATYKDVTARTISYLALPWNISLGLKMGWRSIDIIWKDFIGDASIDYNYYTKRTLLYGVYIGTIQFFLSDHSLDLHPTEDFIDRHVDNILKLGKAISNLKK